MKIFSIT